MKRLLPILLALLLLCGCSTPPEPIEATTIPTAPTTPPSEPAGLLEPEHELEVLTQGALKVYPLNRDNTAGIFPFGDELLLLCYDNGSQLTKLSGETLTKTASAHLDCTLLPDDPSLQVSSKGITYFDSVLKDLVYLDRDLNEVKRFECPEEILGTPVLSADRKHLYYLTADSLRSINLESGIDRLVRQMSYSSQKLAGLHWDDTLIECQVSDEVGSPSQLFLLASTGELLCESSTHLDLATTSQRYFTTRQDGAYLEMLTGTEDSPVLMLHYPHLGSAAYPILEHNLILTAAKTENQVILDCFRLDDGTHPYSLTLPGNCSPWAIVPVSDGSGAWLILYDGTLGSDLLCRWDYEASTVEDDTVYIGIRRTANQPDEDSLEFCREVAADLSAKHGVQILTWTDATDVQPWDYTLIEEHQVPLILQTLSRLDSALSVYPEGFLREAASEMGDGILRIGLVREIPGNADSGALTDAAGIQFWDDATGNPYLILQIREDMEQHLYHEIFHVIESRIFSLSKALDDWEKLNPPGFSYDYSYLYYQDREDFDLISDNTRSFIDLYSMTFPKEDRARIMEYAMTANRADYFTSPVMQAKLRALCIGIREAYGLKHTEELLLWEQYLAEPIKFKK